MTIDGSTLRQAFRVYDRRVAEFIRLAEHFRGLGYAIDDRPLGSGAKARVYAAEGEGGGRFAIKVYEPETDPELFRGEVEAYVAVGEHPAILRCFGHGELSVESADGEATARVHRYLILERADTDLASLIGASREAGRYRARMEADFLAEMTAMGKSVAAALAQMHARRYRHQDVKPGNILRVGQDWKLADLSCALFVPAASEAGDPTVDPPDKIERRRDTPYRDDLGQLGATLYWALTGAEPVRRKGLRPPSPSRKVRGIPAGLDSVCGKLLHPVVDYCYKHASEVADDLAAVAESRPVAPLAESTVRRVVRGVIARPMPILASLLIAAALGGGMASWQRYRNTRAAQERAAHLIGEVVSLKNQLDLEDTRAEAARREAAEVIDADATDTRREDEHRAAVAEAIVRLAKSEELCRNALKLCEDLPADLRRAQVVAGFEREVAHLAALRERYRLVEDDHRLRRRLDDLLAARVMSVRARRRNRDQEYDYPAIAEGYRAIFRDALGVDPYAPGFDLEAAAATLRDRPGRRRYVAALIDCVLVRTKSIVEKPLLYARHLTPNERMREVAQAADDRDPWTLEFHGAFADPLAFFRGAARFRALARDVDLAVVPLPKLLIVAEMLAETSNDRAAEFLVRVRERYREDPWSAHMLADTLEDRGRASDRTEIVALRKIAFEKRPKTAILAVLLAEAYRNAGDVERADVYRLKAEELDPKLKGPGPNAPAAETAAADPKT